MGEGGGEGLDLGAEAFYIKRAGVYYLTGVMQLVKLSVDDGLLNPHFEGYRLLEQSFETSEVAEWENERPEKWRVRLENGSVKAAAVESDDAELWETVTLQWLDDAGNVVAHSEELQLIAGFDASVAIKYGDDALIVEACPNGNLIHRATYPGLAYVLEGRPLRPHVLFTEQFAILVDGDNVFFYAASQPPARHAPMHIFQAPFEIKDAKVVDGSLLIMAENGALKINW